MMSRQDYEMVAEVISAARGRRYESRVACLLHMQQELSDAMEKQNPAFNKSKFTVACMPNKNDNMKAMVRLHKPS